MMILFLNVNKSMIELYGEKGIINIPFQNAEQLYNNIEENSNILYITNAVHTTPAEVINMIKGMGVAVQDDTIVDTGMKYLYSASEGTIYINEFLKFNGEFDIKLIDEEMAQTIRNNKLLQQLINNKKIEIIDETKRRKVMMKYKSNQKNRLEKQKQIDDGLDSIIVKTTVANRVEEGIQDFDHSSAEEIDILGAGRVADSGGISTMSELTNEIEGF